MLSVLSSYIPYIPPTEIDGVYGAATRAAVLAAQRQFRLPETGVVDANTWNEIYDQYSGIENTTLRSGETFPNASNSSARTNNRTNYAQTTTQTHQISKLLMLLELKLKRATLILV